MSSIIRKMLNKPTASEAPSGGSDKQTEIPSSSSSFKVLPLRGSDKPANSPRIFVIGAGSRGSAYARAIHSSTIGTVVGVAEPIEYKRNSFVSRYKIDTRGGGLVFSSWTDIIKDDETREKIRREVDGICICTLDETHAEV